MEAFTPLPAVPDHPALELEILERWQRERTFERLREQNRGGPIFSFMDGPITANAPAGGHPRVRPGEVRGERGLGSKKKGGRGVFGLAVCTRRCRDFVAHFAGIQTEQSRRL